jgi:thiol-disulfide isomerase/thioredoxin
MACRQRSCSRRRDRPRAIAWRCEIRKFMACAFALIAMTGCAYTLPKPFAPVETPTLTPTVAARATIVPAALSRSCGATYLLPSTRYRSDDQAKLNVAGKAKLVEFFAFWCSTCNLLMPIVHGLESKYGNCVSFVYLDIDNVATQSAQERLGYNSQPSFVLLNKSGKIVWRKNGSPDEAELELQLKGVIRP